VESCAVLLYTGLDELEDGFVPDAFYDVITGELIEDPVIALDNRTYSRQSIIAWIDQCKANGEVP
jgi:hypothetical protein